MRPRAGRPAGQRTSRRPVGGATAVGLGILLSRIAGLVRERVTAHYLGTSPAAGALKAALRIPNILQNLLGEGVLSASFVPVYARLLAAGQHRRRPPAGAHRRHAAGAGRQPGRTGRRVRRRAARRRDHARLLRRDARVHGHDGADPVPSHRAARDVGVVPRRAQSATAASSCRTRRRRCGTWRSSQPPSPPGAMPSATRTTWRCGWCGARSSARRCS
jgi:hypothetical protein